MCHNGWAEPVSSRPGQAGAEQAPITQGETCNPLTSLTQDCSGAMESISIVLYINKSKCYVFIYL